MDFYNTAAFYIAGLLVVADFWLLPDAVNGHGDDMPDALTANFKLAACAVAQHVGHGEQGLECVALRPTCRADVEILAAGFGGKIQNSGHHIRGDAGAVVSNSESVVLDRDAHIGSDAAVFSRIQRVVHEFLERDLRPLLAVVPGLQRQFLFGKVVQ